MAWKELRQIIFEFAPTEAAGRQYAGVKAAVRTESVTAGPFPGAIACPDLKFPVDGLWSITVCNANGWSQ